MTIIVKRCHGNCSQTLRAIFEILMILLILINQKNIIVIITILIIGGDCCHGNCGQTLRAKFKIFMIFFIGDWTSCHPLSTSRLWFYRQSFTKITWKRHWLGCLQCRKRTSYPKGQPPCHYHHHHRHQHRRNHHHRRHQWLFTFDQWPVRSLVTLSSPT